MFMPEVIVYGRARPPVHFLVGIREDGFRCKIRFYNKWDFIGVSPLSDSFSKKGMLWLVRCRKAKDGACDIIQAYPIAPDGKRQDAFPKRENSKLPLEAQLLSAESRKLSLPKIHN